MPLYRAMFERFNFGITPPLRQSADVLLCSDLPNDAAHESELWHAMHVACFEQNPHWGKCNGPDGLPTGWSSVLGGHEIEVVAENATLSFAWHCDLQEWIRQDCHTTTIDVDEAGRFTPEQILELQALLPGPPYPRVMSKMVNDIFDKDGCKGPHVRLQLRYDDYVIWGYGDRKSVVEHVDVAKVVTEYFTLDFELPKVREGYPAPREYERVRTWGWRFFWEGGGGGESWTIANSKDEAIAAAREDAITQMRSSGHRHCNAWLAVKHNVEIIDAIEKRAANAVLAA